MRGAVQTELNTEDGYYQGYAVGNQREGPGLMFYSNDSKFIGIWSNNQWVYGQWTKSCKCIYEGAFTAKKLNGQGQIKKCNETKSEYVGELVNNMRHGKGIATNNKGFKYVGEFRNDEVEGFGKIKTETGYQFEGHFVKGVPNGEGTKTKPSGHVVSGNFVDGTAQGHCIYMWPSGSIYEGEMKDEVRHGKGKMVDHCGCCEYEGEWFDDDKHGIGIEKRKGVPKKVRYEKDKLVETLD